MRDAASSRRSLAAAGDMWPPMRLALHAAFKVQALWPERAPPPPPPPDKPTPAHTSQSHQ